MLFLIILMFSVLQSSSHYAGRYGIVPTSKERLPQSLLGQLEFLPRGRVSLCFNVMEYAFQEEIKGSRTNTIIKDPCTGAIYIRTVLGDQLSCVSLPEGLEPYFHMLYRFFDPDMSQKSAPALLRHADKAALLMRRCALEIQNRKQNSCIEGSILMLGFLDFMHSVAQEAAADMESVEYKWICSSMKSVPHFKDMFPEYAYIFKSEKKAKETFNEVFYPSEGKKRHMNLSSLGSSLLQLEDIGEPHEALKIFTQPTLVRAFAPEREIPQLIEHKHLVHILAFVKYRSDTMYDYLRVGRMEGELLRMMLSVQSQQTNISDVKAEVLDFMLFNSHTCDFPKFNRDRVNDAGFSEYIYRHKMNFIFERTEKVFEITLKTPWSDHLMFGKFGNMASQDGDLTEHKDFLHTVCMRAAHAALMGCLAPLRNQTSASSYLQTLHPASIEAHYTKIYPVLLSQRGDTLSLSCDGTVVSAIDMPPLTDGLKLLAMAASNTTLPDAIKEVFAEGVRSYLHASAGYDQKVYGSIVGLMNFGYLMRQAWCLPHQKPTKLALENWVKEIPACLHPALVMSSIVFVPYYAYKKLLCVLLGGEVPEKAHIQNIYLNLNQDYLTLSMKVKEKDYKIQGKVNFHDMTQSSVNLINIFLSLEDIPKLIMSAVQEAMNCMLEGGVLRQCGYDFLEVGINILAARLLGYSVGSKTPDEVLDACGKSHCYREVMQSLYHMPFIRVSEVKKSRLCPFLDSVIHAQVMPRLLHCFLIKKLLIVPSEEIELFCADLSGSSRWGGWIVLRLPYNHYGHLFEGEGWNCLSYAAQVYSMRIWSQPVKGDGFYDDQGRFQEYLDEFLAVNEWGLWCDVLRLKNKGALQCPSQLIAQWTSGMERLEHSMLFVQDGAFSCGPKDALRDHSAECKI